MTAISVFSTFTNRHNKETLQLKNLENLYMISDSRLSLYDGKTYKNYDKQQKIFYDRNGSVVFGIAGMYIIGRKIIRKSLDNISDNPSILKAHDLSAKVDEISKVVTATAAKFHVNNFTHPTTIICNTVHDKKFASVKFFIPAGSNTVTKNDCDIMERISVTTDGMDGEPFEKYIVSNKGQLDSYITPAAKHFTLFLDFLNSKTPLCSGPPCQGAVLNWEGNIKELSIKHEDGNFYKMGILHQDREIRKYEIDYRDFKFNFLSASKIK